MPEERKVKKRANELKKEFLKTMIQLATAGFGLTAALAWNETIQAIIKTYIPANGSGIVSKLLYAVLITAIAVFVTYTLGKMIQDETEKEDTK